MVGLRDGLLELGYRENEQFVLGVRFTQGDLTALPAAARELVQYGVDIIFTSDDSPAKAAQMATTRIPIVFSVVSDPVGLGLIQSFARPGGNITGVTDLRLELGPKRLEVFHEIVPGLKRVLYPLRCSRCRLRGGGEDVSRGCSPPWHCADREASADRGGGAGNPRPGLAKARWMGSWSRPLPL